MTVLIYPIVTSLIFGNEKTRIKEVCKLTPILVLSCIIGNVSHIFLDVFIHRLNSILWLFVDPNEIPGILTLTFAFTLKGDINLGSIYASVLLHVTFISLTLVIVFKSRKNRWELILLSNNPNY